MTDENVSEEVEAETVENLETPAQDADEVSGGSFSWGRSADTPTSTE